MNVSGVGGGEPPNPRALGDDGPSLNKLLDLCTEGLGLWEKGLIKDEKKCLDKIQTSLKKIRDDHTCQFSTSTFCNAIRDALDHVDDMIKHTDWNQYAELTAAIQKAKNNPPS